MDSEAPGSIEDGMTWGNIALKMNATAPTIPTVCSAKAHPSRPSRVVTTTPRRLAPAATAGMSENRFPEWENCAHSTQTSETTAEGTESRWARRAARTWIGPAVLSAVKIAPWVRNRPRVTRPPSRVNGVRRDSIPPVS